MKKEVKVFGVASFLNDMGSDIVYPVWPLFVSSFLGANMEVLGFLDGLGDALVSMSQAASGYLSDKIRKRKIFVWLGYCMGAFSRIGYAASMSWQHLIPFRILDRAGKIRSSPRDATIADLSTSKDRGRNFGFLRAMDNSGAVLGVLLSLFLFNILGYKKLFLIASLPSLIGAALIVRFIKEKKNSGTQIYKGFLMKNLSRDFKLFLFLSSLFALGSFSYSFLLIFAKNFGFKTGFIPVLYLIFTLVASLVSLPFGHLSDKIGRRAVLTISFLLWGAMCLTFIFNQSHWAIVSAIILYGLHKGALEPVQRAFVSELSPEETRASALGVFQMVIGFFALPASYFAGILWDKVNIFTPFYLSLGLTLMALVTLIFVKK